MPASDAPNMTTEALALAAAGFRVFPVHTPRGDHCSCARHDCDRIGKHPRNAHGLREATRELDPIRDWWRKWPDANVAIATGSGLVVLDVDVHKDGSSANLDLPDTRRAVTGSGGEHWYMSAEGPVGNSVQLVGPGLDVRGDGGYVLAPPSLHACGRRYAWDAGGATTIAKAPEWFLRMARAKRLSSDAPDSPDAFVAGARNDAMSAFAGSMRRKGFREASIVAALLEENAARCRPPLDEDEVRRTARSIGRYVPGDPVNPILWPVVTGEALGRKLPPIPWLCRELGIAPGAVTLLAGSNHSGKTMLLQSLAVAMATGSTLWGRFKVEPGKVLHVDYEQGKDVTFLRYQRMAIARGAWSDLWKNLGVSCLPGVYLDVEDALAKLETAIVSGGYRVCILDSLKAAWPSADENSSDVRKWLDALLPVSERTGCVFIVIHHTRKISKDQLGGTKMMIRGSSAIADACGSIFSLVDTGVKGRVTLYHDKARLTGHRVDPFTLSIEDIPLPVESLPADIAAALFSDLASNETGSLRLGLDVLASNLDPSQTLEGRLVAFIQRHPACGIREIRMGIEGRATELDQALKRLIRDGVVAERIGWRGKRIHDLRTREPGEDFD